MLDRRAAKGVAADSVSAGARAGFEGGGSACLLAGLFPLSPPKREPSSSAAGGPTGFFGCGRPTGNAKAAVPVLRGDGGGFSLEGDSLILVTANRLYWR